MLIPVAACTRRARRRLSPREDETHIDVVCRWLSADKDRATATHTLVAHAFVNNSGADDADDGGQSIVRNGIGDLGKGALSARVADCMNDAGAISLRDARPSEAMTSQLCDTRRHASLASEFKSEFKTLRRIA